MRGLATADDLVPDLEGASAQEVLEHLVEHFHPRLYVACSFQKEASVIMDMLLKVEPEARFFTLDTGLLFPETQAPAYRVHREPDAVPGRPLPAAPGLNGRAPHGVGLPPMNGAAALRLEEDDEERAGVGLSAGDELEGE